METFDMKLEILKAIIWHKEQTHGKLNENEVRQIEKDMKRYFKKSKELILE